MIEYWPMYFEFTDRTGKEEYDIWYVKQKRYNSYNKQCHGQFSFSTGCTMVFRLLSTTDFNSNGHIRNANNQKTNKKKCKA